MPLPTISTPTYELIIPSSNRKIKYRPFLVKEEKILILAMESQDSTQIANAVKDVISNCIISRGIKVDKLSTFDIEYLFLN
ncbi:MAG: baseplate protein, partial [Pseudomonadota bacterium]|nr:baseplate protein [Pseudomonadota bacterium]